MLDRPKRIYMLATYTVERRQAGWFFTSTYRDDIWRGPYSSMASACLMIARELLREIKRRDASHDR